MTNGEGNRRGTLVERRWEPNLAALGGRRARRGFTYQAFVPPRIAGEEFRLSSSVAEAAVAAERECRRLNDDPPALLNLEALARQLLRAESVASSRIEGLVLSHRRLAEAAFSPDVRDLTAQSVLANIAALERAVVLGSEVDELEASQVVEVHRVLFEGTRDERLGGVIREEQNWIGGSASSPENAEFIPPPHELVAELLDDLCSFCNRDDLPAVIQAAVAHAQFETIHPFLDGNGRVGRALILVVLRRRGVALRYLPPVSLALAGRADRYVAGLESYRAGNEGDWFGIFADAVYRASTGARHFAEAVSQLQARWSEQAGRPRRGAAARRLIGLLPSHPILDVRTATDLLQGSDETARLAVLRLEEAGVLRQTTLGRRNRTWECVGLFHLLDEFERELGPADRTPRPTS